MYMSVGINTPVRPDTSRICRWWRRQGLEAIGPLYCIERVGVLEGRGGAGRGGAGRGGGREGGGGEKGALRKV